MAQTLNNEILPAPIYGVLNAAVLISGIKVVAIGSGNLANLASPLSGAVTGVSIRNALPGEEVTILRRGAVYPDPSMKTDGWWNQTGWSLYVGSGGMLISSGDVSSDWNKSLVAFVISGGLLVGDIVSGVTGKFNVSGDIGSGQIGRGHLASGAVASGVLGVSGVPTGAKFFRDDWTWASPDAAGLSSGSVQSGHLGNDSVLSGSVGSGQIASGHLTSGLLSSLTGGLTSGAVTSGHIGDGAVVSGSVASGHIASGHLASGLLAGISVGSGSVMSGTVGWPHLSPFAVRSGHLEASSVTSGSVASGQVGGHHLASGVVSSGHLGTTGIPTGSKFLRDDFSWQAAGGGAGNTGMTTLNFGSFPGASDASVAVTGQTSIASGSIVEAWIRPEATADHSADEHMLETIKVFAGNIVAGTGFTIYGFNTSETFEPVPLLDGMGRVTVSAGPGKQDNQSPNARGGVGTRIYGQFTIAWRWS